MSKIRKVCVIGWPVAHSRSPLIHNYWIKKYSVENALYEPLAVAPENLLETIGNLAALGYVGANVTVPHKEAAFKALPHCDPTASRLHAVNTLVKTGDHFEGRNTDGYGFMANLQAGAPKWRAASGPVVLLGAGGAARAIAAALDEAGAPEIRILNRTRERAEQLIADLKLTNAKYVAPADVAFSMRGANLLVNTTSLGMKGTDEIAYPLEQLPFETLVSDIVYTPLQTGLLSQARARGNPIVDGIGMLLHQAVPGFEAWFGIRPEVTPELRALVMNDLGA